MRKDGAVQRRETVIRHHLIPGSYFHQADMSTRYLLPCSCGLSTPVEIAQAGHSVRCSCGASLEVPTLRGIKNLPPAPLEAVPQGPVWNPGKGILFLGALAILAGLAIEAYLPTTVPSVDFNRIHAIAFTMNPAQSWEQWQQFQQDRLPGAFTPESEAYRRSETDRRRWWFVGWAGVAAGAGMVYCGYWMLQNPRTKVET